MKKNRIIPNLEVDFPKGVKLDENKEKFRPLSYYVLGGTDLSGDALKCDASVDYDDEESITPKIITDDTGAHSYGDLQTCAMCDPRISSFDIVEQIGADKAQEAYNEKIAEIAKNNQTE